MPTATEVPATPVVEKARRTPKARRHPLEENPPPPMRLYTIKQEESNTAALKEGYTSGSNGPTQETRHIAG